MENQEENYQSKNVMLESPSQLPNLDCWQLSFVMQEHYTDGANHLIITNGGTTIWKEYAYWEYYESFIRIGEVLIRKYGNRMMDFIPDVKWINIYGDSLSGAFIVHDFRMKIREKYNKRIVTEKNKEEQKKPKKKWVIKHENQIKLLKEKEDIYKEKLKRNSILIKLAAEDRRKNPKTILDRWINKFKQRK